jgi:AcrR family transcriptional regulator
MMLAPKKIGQDRLVDGTEHMTTIGRPRPGGRTARTRDAVHAAVRELIAESGSEHVVIADVAARSGVHAATIYRRWGRPELLVLDVAVDRLQDQLPVPATGDLRADLLAYTKAVADDLIRPGGLAFLRAVLAASAAPATSDLPGTRSPRSVVDRRLEDFQVMLDHAGPAAGDLTALDVVDGILAPLYLRILFGGADSVNDVYAQRLVTKLMRQATAS